MRINDLFEMPMTNLSLVGDFNKSSSFRHAQDRKLLSNPKAVQKIKGMWKYPEEVNYNVICVNHPDGSKWMEIGEVSHDWLEKNMPRVFPQIEPLLDMHAMNIIYTNNNGDERMPMTGWIMAHRLGHAFQTRRNNAQSYYMGEAIDTFNRYVKDVLEHYRIPFNVANKANYYEPQTRNGPSLGFLREICTFKAARDNNIRNPMEVVHDLMAQFMLTGNIRFNDIPKNFKYGPRHYGLPGNDPHLYEHLNSMIVNDLSYELRSLFETALYQGEGKIYVM